MNVQISVGGKFHAFDLARELEARQYLSSLITSYPKRYVAPYSIRPEHICSLPLKQILQLAWEYTPRFVKQGANPYFFLHELFDRSAALHVRACDIFVGFSSFALHSMMRAREMGAMLIVERGSAHIVLQRNILEEEYELVGCVPSERYIPHPSIVEKELLEYAQSDAICVPSIFAKKSFIQQGVPSHKIIHIPYGVDLTLFRPTIKRDAVFRVIFAGGLIMRKGVHYLVQAFAELNLPHAELLLIGPETDQIRPYLKKYAGGFRRVDYYSMSELADVYSQGSVFALLSVEDGFGLVLIQAMACGLPVVATDHTGAPDMVRDGIDGFIIPIRDVDACKEKIQFLYENQDLCRSMGESARKRVEAGFSWSDYGDRMVAAYARILNAQTGHCAIIV